MNEQTDAYDTINSNRQKDSVVISEDSHYDQVFALIKHSITHIGVTQIGAYVRRIDLTNTMRTNKLKNMHGSIL